MVKVLMKRRCAWLNSGLHNEFVFPNTVDLHENQICLYWPSMCSLHIQGEQIVAKNLTKI